MSSPIMPLAALPLAGLLKRAAAGLLSACAPLVVALAVASCSPPEPILKGKRIAVLPEVTVEVADPAALAEGSGLPAVVNINTAAMPGLNAGHAGGNPRLQAPLAKIWSSRIGGSGTSLTDLAQPVIGDGRAYTVAPNGVVSAFDVKTGAQIWSVSIEDIDDDPLPGVGGGIAISPEGVLAHAGGRTLALLDAATGTLIWEFRSDLPHRGGPTVIGSDRAAVTDLDGNMKIMTLVSGELVWTHLGIAANTVLFGAPAPAYAGDEIALAGAAGEVSYFDAATGELIWTDSVASLMPRTPIQNLGDVRAHPVHDGGLIFVISQSGRLVAFSARNGLPVWERAIAGLEMPWIAGDSLFVLSLDGRLYAIRRDDGVIRWVNELDGAVPLDVVVPESPPRYFGPVVAGDRVYVVSGGGVVQSFDPNSGAALESFATGKTIRTAPQVAGGRMYLVSVDGMLTAIE